MHYRWTRHMGILCALLVLSSQPQLAAATPAQGSTATTDATTLNASEDEAVTRYLVDTGPLRVRDQFLLGMGFLAFDPGPANVLPKGQWQVDTVLTVTNSWANSDAVEKFLEDRDQRLPFTESDLDAIDASVPTGIFHLDGEVYRTAIAVRRGISKKFQLEVTVPFLSFRGGSLDDLIEGTHDLFNLGQAGRLGTSRDNFRLFLTGPETRISVDKSYGTALGDIVLGAKYGLREETPTHRWAVSVEGLVKLPTGSEERLSSSGSADAGVQVLTTRYFNKSCLHGSLGVLYLGDNEYLTIDSQILLSGMLAIERLFTKKSTLHAQLTVSQTPFDDLELPLLSKTSIQVTLGYKRALSAKSVLLFGFTENIQNFNNTADIGFHVGWTTAF